ncbi:MMPL family transporter [Serinibacter salmoneus]|uniref:RND superfamily putative drug exporter n=1 Tax=Serinibacter salmoneus TaxID=556530 RepID=A0A2A9D435_9MICO|nr:MMPL family transporter [Serinibacter salmoneus]PFG21015.1 RND superfamily putative drug exporter [Serinibacter salmoneus]
MSSLLFALTRWVIHARRLVISLWLVAFVAISGGAVAINQGFDSAISIPGTESQDALESLSAVFPEIVGASAQVIVVAPEGTSVLDPSITEPVDQAVEDFQAVDHVVAVSEIDGDLLAADISDDEQAALLTIQLDQGEPSVTDETKDELRDVAEDLAAALPEGTQSEIGGSLFAVEIPGFTATEALGVIVAFFVLVLALGTVVAASLPLVNAILGVALTTVLMLGATSVASINTTTPLLSVMLGLAVGIDYALFIVSRHRDQLREGIDVHESIARAVATAGSAVIFAGLTVMIALVGLSVAGIPFLTTMGIAAAAGVGVAVLVSLTFLPALLAVVGPRLLSRRARRSLNQGTAGGEQSRKPAGFFAGWVRVVTAKPVLTLVTLVVAVGALALPAQNLKLALPGAGSLPQDNSARITYDLVSEHFGEGYNGMLLLTTPIVTSTDPVGLMEDLAEEISALPGVVDVPLATPNQDATVGVITVIPQDGPTTQETADLVHQLREDREVLNETYGVDLQVTGFTAAGIDVSEKLGAALLPFGVVVVGLSLILLAMVFRSVWVPITATLGYILSVAAAFGASTLVFEYGWFGGLLNVTDTGPIISFMPILLMGVLFGLAMDYEVFLVSRMREEYVHGKDARAAIHAGFRGSASVVTAAAIIMIAVFVAFVPHGDQNIKPIALGLAIGVAVDAFVVRMALIPAIMTLLGDRAWWIPRWLDRLLPTFDVEGEGLVRELDLAQWPDQGVVVAARNLRVTDAHSEVLPATSLEVPDGAAQVVTATSPRQVQAFLLSVAGRLKVTEGDVKVDGFLLPDRGARVRRLVAVLHAQDVAGPQAAAVALNAARRDGARVAVVDLTAAADLPRDLAALAEAAPSGLAVIAGALTSAVEHAGVRDLPVHDLDTPTPDTTPDIDTAHTASHATEEIHA